MSTTHVDVHAAAMKRTANFYDAVVASSTLPPASTLSSLSPAWIIESSLSGGIWGPLTEHTEHALAVADSYGVKPRYSLLKYPAIGPRNRDNDEVFYGVQSYEPRSLVFKTLDERDVCDSPVFSERGEQHAAGPEISAPPQPEVYSPQFRYQLVTEDNLNAQYAQYLSGTETVATVMETVTDFVQRKLELGSGEFGFQTDPNTARQLNVNRARTRCRSCIRILRSGNLLVLRYSNRQQLDFSRRSRSKTARLMQAPPLEYLVGVHAVLHRHTGDRKARFQRLFHDQPPLLHTPSPTWRR
jgi:hypothetical protein